MRVKQEFEALEKNLEGKVGLIELQQTIALT